MACCVLCFSLVDNPEHWNKADCQLKHNYYPNCLKLKYNLASAVEAVNFVKNKCPACVEIGLISFMSSITNQLSKLDKLDKLDVLEKSAELLNNKVDDIKIEQAQLAGKYCELEKRVVELEKNKPTSDLKEVADKVTKVADLIIDCNLEQRALFIETHAMENELSLSGLQEHSGENLKSVLTNLFGVLNIDYNDSYVKYVKRIGKPTVPGSTVARQKQRDILIKLDCKDTVDKIISKSKTTTIPSNRLLLGSDVSSDSVRLHRRHPPSLYKFR